MKLLSVYLARAIWLGHVLDFNPKGVSLYQALSPFLVDTYKFRKFPSSAESADMTKGISFQDGEFTAGEEYPMAVNFTIYNDGLIADTISSTNYSEAFLNDLFVKFSVLFTMPDYRSIIRRKAYLSQIFVTTGRSIEFLNPKLNQISKYLSENVEEDKAFQVGGISFWPDQISKVNPAPFTFERASNVPFSENRYYSAAPLPTDKHLELLDKLENIFA